MRTLSHRLHLPLATVLSVCLLYLMSGTASAHAVIPTHAKVTKAIPAIGSTVSQAPTTVTVFALENINPDPNKSNLFIYSPAGDLISQGNAKVSLTNPEEMSITIKPDTANLNGVYVVQWKTVSALDGDPDQGAFVFTVNTGAVAAPTPAVTATNLTGQSTTPTTNTTGTGGTPIWVPSVVGIVALLIGLGAGLGFGRRRSASSIGAMRRAVTQQSKEEEPIN
ncbi:MAG TPA: copper resistance CopC family protein [Ktedonobacteraceae bacterium]